MDHVTSQDGTSLAYQRLGAGPPVVLVGGAFTDHAALLPLARQLAADHTAVAYDRRARGGSGDSSPGVAGAVQREVDDLSALVDAVGGQAALVGSSSGAVLALAAAERGVGATHLVLFEPPFTPEGMPAEAPKDLPEQILALLGQGRAGEAVELFQTRTVGLPTPVVAQIRRSPAWPELEALPPSLVYDAVVTRDHPHASAFTSVTTPTLVLSGDRTWPRLREAAQTTAQVLPHAEHRSVEGADHALVPEAVAAAVRSFLGGAER